MHHHQVPFLVLPLWQLLPELAEQVVVLVHCSCESSTGTMEPYISLASAHWCFKLQVQT
jgi:hypothetical protein